MRPLSTKLFCMLPYLLLSLPFPPAVSWGRREVSDSEDGRRDVVGRQEAQHVGAGKGHVAPGPVSQVLMKSQLSSHSYIHDWGVPQFPYSAL